MLSLVAAGMPWALSGYSWHGRTLMCRNAVCSMASALNTINLRAANLLVPSIPPSAYMSANAMHDSACAIRLGVLQHEQALNLKNGALCSSHTWELVVLSVSCTCH